MSASPETLDLLGRVAELRAAGVRWADAAAQLATDVQALRRLAAEHPRDYERLCRRARNELLRETLDAALASLREQMRAPETMVRLTAATTVIRYAMARMRHGEKAAAARLLRDTQPDGRRRLTAGFDSGRAPDVRESAEVQQPKEVAPAKTMTPQAPSRPQPATVAKAIPPASAHAAPPPDALARKRNQLLVDLAVGRGAPATVARGDALDAEIDRLASRRFG